MPGTEYLKHYESIAERENMTVEQAFVLVQMWAWPIGMAIAPAYEKALANHPDWQSWVRENPKETIPTTVEWAAKVGAHTQRRGLFDFLGISVTGSDWWGGECTRIYISSDSAAMYMAHTLPPLWDIHPEVHAMLDSMRGTGVDGKGHEFDVGKPMVYHRRLSDNDALIPQPYLITFVVSRNRVHGTPLR
jgi:hypothetical protein